MFLLEVFLPCRLQQLADTKRERRGRREHGAAAELLTATVGRGVAKVVLQNVGRGARGRQRSPPEGKIHRVDSDFESTLKVSNRGLQSNCWVNRKITVQPCEFQVRGGCEWWWQR